MTDRATVDRLAGLARDTAARCASDDLRAGLCTLGDRLDEPLKVAVAGRMKAGKSTVVNALLGRSIAPTAATECTKVVARYVYADDEGVRVQPIDGDPYSVPPTVVGGPPDDLGRLAADIDYITVRMSSSRRREWTLVDTPGLDSTTSGVSASTERAVLGDAASARATSTVDALIYLMPHPGEADVNFIGEFGAVFDGTRLGAVNIVGVLSKIDLLDGAGRSDPWTEARRLAQRMSEELAGVVDRVVPVSGLLAQAAVAGEYREHHTTLIRTLASVEPAALRRSLRRVDRFTADEGLGLDADERRRLVDVLGAWGIGEVVAAYRTGVTTTRTIVNHLRDRSNLDELTAAIDGRLAAGAALVRTASCLEEMERLAYRALGSADAAAAKELSAAAAAVRARPDFHRIVEMQTLRTFVPERSRLDPGQRRDVLAVLRGTDLRSRLLLPESSTTAEVRGAARERAQMWRGIENGARTRRADQTVAAVLRRTYELAAGEEPTT